MIPPTPPLWSRWKRLLFTASFTLFVFGVSCLLDWFLTEQRDPRLRIGIVSDVIAAVIIGLLVWELVALVEARRRALYDRLERIERINHHIRNALQVITLFAHRQDPEAVREIDDAVDRIDWALREILPGGAPTVKLQRRSPSPATDSIASRSAHHG